MSDCAAPFLAAPAEKPGKAEKKQAQQPQYQPIGPSINEVLDQMKSQHQGGSNFGPGVAVGGMVPMSTTISAVTPATYTLASSVK